MYLLVSYLSISYPNNQISKKSPMPTAIYVARPNIRRVVLVDAIKTLLLCGLFYAAVRVNIYLFLRYRVLSAEPPVYLQYAIIGVLLLLLVVELLTVYRKHTIMVYDFYPEHIELYGSKPQTLSWSMVEDVKLKRSLADRVFGTGTIILKPGFRIEHIEAPEAVFTYVQRLVTQAKGQVFEGQAGQGMAGYQNYPGGYPGSPRSSSA